MCIEAMHHQRRHVSAQAWHEHTVMQPSLINSLLYSWTQRAITRHIQKTPPITLCKLMKYFQKKKMIFDRAGPHASHMPDDNRIFRNAVRFAEITACRVCECRVEMVQRHATI